LKAPSSNWRGGGRRRIACRDHVTHTKEFSHCSANILVALCVLGALLTALCRIAIDRKYRRIVLIKVPRRFPHTLVGQWASKIAQGRLRIPRLDGGKLISYVEDENAGLNLHFSISSKLKLVKTSVGDPSVLFLLASLFDVGSVGTGYASYWSW
jgi:hypothetical protein